jgi:hypothetical protein
LEESIMLRKFLLGLMLVTAFGIAEAETLLIDAVEAEQATRSERPRSGQTKAQVEARFGAPTQMIAAVGDPPISRWVYPAFTVYFEYDRVIHAVPRHT